MRRIMVAMLLLSAVALSTGVMLPRPPSLQPGPDSVSDQSSSDSHSQVSECDVLRRLFRSEAANWVFKSDSSQEENNDHINKRQDNIYNYQPTENEWYSFDKQYYQPQNTEGDYLYGGDSYGHDQPHKWAYESPALPAMDAVYSQNKDILVSNGHAYYLYDAYMAATSPFDHIQNGHNCLYNAMLRSTSKTAQPTDGHASELQEKRDRLKTNGVNPVAGLVNKRDDVEEIGEMEQPETLIVNEGDTGEVRKKLFSFWSRLQALSHKGRQLPTRRHTFVFYGPDGSRDGPLTAETRASHLRPPGQPLRWG